MTLIGKIKENDGTSHQNFMIICLTLHISLHANIMSSTV